MERSNRMLIEDIKAEVMEELRHNQGYPNRYHNSGYQAYCQLVDAVKHDVISQLEHQFEWRAGHNARYAKAGFSEQQLSPEEINLIKREVLRDLQLGMDGENQKISKEQ